MNMSRRARLILLLVSIVLFIPVLGIAVQQKSALETFHQRTLPDWPPRSGFLPDPAKYFADAKTWLALRVYPIADVSLLQKKFLLSVLNTAPQRRVTLAARGFIFLNGTDDGHLNNILDMVCIRAHSPEVSGAFAAALPRVAAYAQGMGLPIDVEVFPSPETLYGDLMPASVPRLYRDACGARAAGHSPLMRIIAPPNLQYVFPFSQMHAARDDEAFFPKGNWHAEGMSLVVGRDAYLKQLHVAAPVPETLERGFGPAELLMTYGIRRDLPIYHVIAPSRTDDGEANARMRAAITDLFLNPRFVSNAYRNTKPVVPETLLILSDSYGNNASAIFANAFKSVFQVMANDMKPNTVVEMIERIRQIAPIDRILILVQEGNTDRIVDYADAFDKATSNAMKH